MNIRRLKKAQVLIISTITIFLDQISKYWAQAYLIENVSVPFIPHAFNLRFVQNTGAAFSLFRNSTFLLAILSLVTSIFLLFWLWQKSPLTIWQGLSIGLLLGGCIGNGLDRWRLRYVIDFIEIVPINFPIFNVADVAINIAIICIFIDTLYKRNAKSHR